MAPDAAARPTRAEMRMAAREQSRAQRRDAAKAATRTALLRVALPSVAALGVAAAAAVTVQGDADQRRAQAAGLVPDQVTPATAADSAPARDAAQQALAGNDAPQASRADAREPLAGAQPAGAADPGGTDPAGAGAVEAPQQQRPAVSLPVAQHGLGEMFGAAGTHWAKRHTGIDFPVDGGTPVMAVTDGTIRTQWNPSYGYMTILKMADGTEAWYCHLRSYKIRKGTVKAGDVIAFVGSSGNSTGPHLHFEIRPASGTGPVDPLPWFLAQGVDPR
ncbi:peptidoglycan DD-metalloendopeptidase family protein [Kitasatospora sp. CM 4170]|uniref:Peptidoglycan DD-metalloendopeptidase family protein n=1 Tax=Kitasatospora aburaviensis TaxID=67265 RepID=A0ABW1F849_9ACTN|nr:peptidoglycan DD-metalloendopeptidase family protein [Kitasatospora sp. CM 4170]WNM46187.1 peptidoglycan DD-metalloendopeptidase family protein [Kitasatospora sp. CM 4170]